MTIYVLTAFIVYHSQVKGKLVNIYKPMTFTTEKACKDVLRVNETKNKGFIGQCTKTGVRQ